MIIEGYIDLGVIRGTHLPDPHGKEGIRIRVVREERREGQCTREKTLEERRGESADVCVEEEEEEVMMIQERDQRSPQEKHQQMGEAWKRK